MTLLAISIALLALAAIPIVMYVVNLPFYRPAQRVPESAERQRVSVLIPARNEEAGIADAVNGALQSDRVDLEIIVLDDHSEDRTAAIVREIAERDPRVNLHHSKPLPPGWCGKQHACWQLAQLAAHDTLIFIDADVRLAPHAAARSAHALRSRKLDLLSGVPLQETGTLTERLLIPLIHFLLLGYLPMVGMRFTRLSGFAAGCGQLFVTTREAYDASGGHQAIRQTLHDGLRLPKLYRMEKLRTDVFDATDLAACRMYRGANDVWRGLSKNAGEGLGSPAGIVPWTIILGGGQVLPWGAMLAGMAWAAIDPAPWPTEHQLAFGLTCGAALGGVGLRIGMAQHFRQSLVGALLHPVGVAMLLVIQWSALIKRWSGKQSQWKGRAYAAP